MVTLNNTYIIGAHVMFYEIEMLGEYVDSCVNMASEVSNKQNITFHFTFNTSEYFETVDTNLISTEALYNRFLSELDKLKQLDVEVILELKDNHNPPYNIANYRRDLNYRYSVEYDFVLWGETDSLWPRDTFQIIEQVDNAAKHQNIYKYILCFSERKMWDSSWKVIEHDDYTNIPFQDDEDWALNNKASSKCYMTIDEMNQVNDKVDSYNIRTLTQPKFDGSCLVIKSDLIKSGVNIPQALLIAGDDTSFGEMAKTIMGNNYVQFVVGNVLRVHNRRHPQKRMYIKGENNARGFCGVGDKGQWWDTMQKYSKSNLANLKNQAITYTMDDVIKSINK